MEHKQSEPNIEVLAAATNDAQAIPEKLTLNEFREREYDAGNTWRWSGSGSSEYRLYLKEYQAKYEVAGTELI